MGCKTREHLEHVDLEKKYQTKRRNNSTHTKNIHFKAFHLCTNCSVPGFSPFFSREQSSEQGTVLPLQGKPLHSSPDATLSSAEDLNSVFYLKPIHLVHFDPPVSLPSQDIL